MKQYILLLIFILSIGSASALPDTQNTVFDVYDMQELTTAINNESIIKFDNCEYYINESINVTSSYFRINDKLNLNIDTLLILNSDHTTITGSEIYPWNPNKRSGYQLPSSCVIITGTLKMDNSTLCGLGPIYKPTFQWGLNILGESSISNSHFKQIERITVFENENVTFNGCTFENAPIRVKLSNNVSFIDTTHELSGIRVFNYKYPTDSPTVYLSNVSVDGDRMWFSDTIINITNSSFQDSTFDVEDGQAHIDNSTFDNIKVRLSAARGSTLTNNIITQGQIYLERSSSSITIRNNDISGHTNGIVLGKQGYCPASLEYTIISSNTIHDTSGAAFTTWKSHPNGKNNQMKVFDNHIYNTSMAIYSRGVTSIYGGTNWYYNNTLDGDVILENRDSRLSDNTITGNLTVSHNGNTVYNNLVSKLFNITNLNEKTIIRNNTASGMNIHNSINILIDSCSIPVYNLYDNSNNNTINTSVANFTTDGTIHNVSRFNHTFTMEQAAHISSKNMAFDITIGNATSLNITNLNGTYDLFRGGILFDSVTSKNNTVSFNKTMGVGNYTIAAHIESVTIPPKKNKRNSNHHYIPVPMPPLAPIPDTNTSTNTTTNTTENTTENTTTVENITPTQKPLDENTVYTKIYSWFKSLFNNLFR